MKALLQRVTAASVSVSQETIGQIEQGLLVLLGVEKNDDEVIAKKLMDRLLAYRVFSDVDGKMNLSVKDSGGSVLLVSQFTLAADTRKGLRPGFSSAAAPQQAEALYEFCVNHISAQGVDIAAGQFGANMQVSLVNDGPVTFLLEIN